MSKMILQEYTDAVSSQASVFLEEATDAFGNKGKQLYMKGIFVQGGIRNANQRIYPVHEIKNAVDSVRKLIADDKAPLGEADHPDDLKINLDRVTHIITDMWIDGPNGYGKLRLLPTPMGNLIKCMLESNVKLGVSSRGSGNVDEATGTVSDFEIVTVDIVANPSAPQAYPTAVYEGLLNSKHGYKTLELAQAASTDKKVQKYLQEAVISLIKDMKLR